MIIGGWDNTAACIKIFGDANNQVIKKVTTHALLACDELRPFWVSWENGFIEVGVGNTYDFSFMSIPLPENVNTHDTVSFGSRNVKAEWEFDERDGKYWTCSHLLYYFIL